MLGWLKKKKNVEGDFSLLLQFSNREFSDSVEKIVIDSDNATRAFILVAYTNLLPILSGAKDAGIINTIDDYIRLTEGHLEKYKDDDIAVRRTSWFLLAGLTARLEKLATSDPALVDVGARIWCQLARSAPFLKNLLPHNVIWDELEKAAFQLNRTDEQMVGDAINHIVPKIFVNHTACKDLAQEFGQTIFLFLKKPNVVP